MQNHVLPMFIRYLMWFEFVRIHNSVGNTVFHRHLWDKEQTALMSWLENFSIGFSMRPVSVWLLPISFSFNKLIDWKFDFLHSQCIFERTKCHLTGKGKTYIFTGVYKYARFSLERFDSVEFNTFYGLFVYCTPLISGFHRINVDFRYAGN